MQTDSDRHRDKIDKRTDRQADIETHTNKLTGYTKIDRFKR